MRLWSGQAFGPIPIPFPIPIPDAGLISEYMIAVVPVILGDGIPLFASAPTQDSLTLVKTTPYQNGIVMLTYRSKGAG